MCCKQFIASALIMFYAISFSFLFSYLLFCILVIEYALPFYLESCTSPKSNFSYWITLLGQLIYIFQSCSISIPFKLNRNWTELERKWNGNGTEMERELNRNGTEIQWKLRTDNGSSVKGSKLVYNCMYGTCTTQRGSKSGQTLATKWRPRCTIKSIVLGKMSLYPKI